MIWGGKNPYIWKHPNLLTNVGGLPCKLSKSSPRTPIYVGKSTIPTSFEKLSDSHNLNFHKKKKLKMSQMEKEILFTKTLHVWIILGGSGPWLVPLLHFLGLCFQDVPGGGLHKLCEPPKIFQPMG